MWTGAHDHLHVGGTRAAGGNTAQRHGRHEGRRHARARDQKQRPETHRNRGLFHGRVHGGVRPRVEVGTESSLQGGSDGGFRSWRAKQTPSNPSSAYGVICSSAARSGGRTRESRESALLGTTRRTQRVGTQGPGQGNSEARRPAPAHPPPPPNYPKCAEK